MRPNILSLSVRLYGQIKTDMTPVFKRHTPPGEKLNVNTELCTEISVSKN
jgi:hypothetical protein